MQYPRRLTVAGAALGVIGFYLARISPKQRAPLSKASQGGTVGEGPLNRNPALSVGTRVKMSELGAARCPGLAGRTGTIVGPTRYYSSLTVQLDGNKTPTSLHQDYLAVC